MSNKAIETMRQNSAGQVVCGMYGNTAIQIRDVRDADGRPYRIEILATPDGKRAVARVLHNPWSRAGEGPNAGAEYAVAHVSPKGFICVGDGANYTLAESVHDLEFVQKRVAYWVNGFSFFKEKGRFPQI
jgi:hypothetical protein